MEERFQSNFKLFQTEDNTDNYGVRNITLSLRHLSIHPFINHLSIQLSIHSTIYLIIHTSIIPIYSSIIFLYIYLLSLGYN